MNEPEFRSAQEYRVDQHKLIEAAMRGNQDSVRALWEHYRRWVAALLLAYKPKETDLEDLLQEVAMTYVRQIGSLRDPNAFRSWIRTVAINTARLAGRKETTRHTHIQGLQRLGRQKKIQPDTPEVILAQREDAQRLLDLALTLPEAYREPLLLRCMQGMSYRKISEMMDLPETTVETRIARGRRMLREKAAAQESIHGANQNTKEKHAKKRD